MSFQFHNLLKRCLPFLMGCVFFVFFLASSVVHAQWGTPDEDMEKSTHSLFSKAEAGVTFMMRGYSFEEGQREAQITDIRFVPFFNLPFHKWFETRTRLWVSVASGRVQARFQDVTTSSPLVIDEAVGIFKPGDFFRLEAGAIHQKHLKAPLLIWRRTFPGALVSTTYKNDKVRVTGKYQYAIPTAFSLDTERTETEAIPELQTLGVSASWTPYSWFFLDADINHFDFGDLPSAVAYRSGITGNLNTGAEPSTAKFQYDFRGLAHRYLFGFRYTPIMSQTFELQIVDNLAAPDNIQRSQTLGTSFYLKFTDFAVRTDLGTFFAESDSSPSYYNSAITGHNNREGYYAGLRVDFTKLGFALETSYVDAKILQPNGSDQSDFSYIEIFLEVANIKF